MGIRKFAAALIGAAAFLGFSPTTFAEQTLDTEAFWHAPDDSFWMTRFGECWQTIEWQPGDVAPGCGYVEPEPPPPKMVTRKVERTISMTADAETFFEFDKAVLTPAADQKLNALMAQVQPFETVKSVQIAAHTDRIGSEAYNQGLSERRAAAVRNWFVNHGISPGLITANAYGESRPVVTCEGQRVTKALIDCLQPNRRAEIAVTVSRTEVKYIEEMEK
ncbi:MAG: OmpA family protein [Chromatiales bacterium]|jgi:OOP family OmpA-OmpF porin